MKGLTKFTAMLLGELFTLVEHLVRTRSDHCPILIRVNGYPSNPIGVRPFRFESAWLLHEKFEEFFDITWGGCNLQLQNKLAFLKGELNEWNTQVFGHIASRKRTLIARLRGILLWERTTTLI